MRARRVVIVIILLLITVAVALGVAGSMYYLRISKICHLIENGNTSMAVQYIENTPNVNCYTAPVWMRGIFNRLFEQDLQLPLVVACKAGDLDVVITLLEQGADPNKYLNGNWSPVEAAIIGKKESRLDIIKTLVANGADVTLYGSHQSALFVELRELMFNGKLTEKDRILTIEIIDFLLTCASSPIEKDSTTLIHYLSYAGNLDMLNEFYPKYCQFLNTQNDKGQTPLMWAVRGGEISIVQFLIESGADISTVDSEGNTAYDYAVLEGHSEIAIWLKMRQGKVDVNSVS